MSQRAWQPGSPVGMMLYLVGWVVLFVVAWTVVNLIFEGSTSWGQVVLAAGVGLIAGLLSLWSARRAQRRQAP